MDLSIIIVNWNTKELVKNCINSIVSSRPNASYEIIVVDNGSTDSSVEALRQLQHSVLNLQLIEKRRNLGFAKASNQGIKIARGEYILLLNSDTKVTSNALDKLLEFASKDKNVGVVGARLLNKDGSIQESCFRLPTIVRAIRQYWLGEKSILDKYYPVGEKPTEVESVVGAAFLISPLARKKTGLLDERYFMYFEDLDYCRRVRRAGFKVYYLPKAEIIHYHGESGKKLVDDRNQWRRLVPSSKIYHGIVGYYIYNFVVWSGQKLRKICH